jgi:outer membrane beta-barrel protein
MKAQSTLVWILLAGFAAAPTAYAKSKKSTDTSAAPAAAPTDPNAPATNTPNEKLDVSDLENKYWAPKDTDFSVVQNRTFTKENKWFVSGEFGPDISGGNYTAGNHLGVDLGYFWSERYGVQATYLSSYLHNNSVVGDLIGKGGYPNYGIMQDYYGLGFSWVPFYSKMSFLGKKILYFDMAITPTIGITDYDQQSVTLGPKGQSAFTYGFDITQYYFFTSHFAFRIDLKNQWYNEDVIQSFSGSAPAGSSIKTNTDREMIFLFGFTYYFGL